MVRSIKVSPKYALFSTCLLLLLVAGITAHTAGQLTNLSLDLYVFGLQGPLYQGSEPYPCDDGRLCVYFQAVVNGQTYCLYGYLTSDPITVPITVQVYGGNEGECDLPITLDYIGVGGGGFVTSGYHPSAGFTATGTVTIDLTGVALPYAFTLVVDITAGGITIQSKITGNLGIGCSLTNLVSQYAFVKGGGLNLSLQLLAATWFCDLGQPSHLHLTLTFGNAAAPVGGVIIPVSALGVLAPWLAAVGIVGCIVTVLAVAKKRRS